MIAATGATIAWGGPALGPFDLAVGPGERVLVSGPSGGGKSSLLRRLAGLAAGGGAVLAGDRPVEELTAAERRAALAFVAQEPLDQLVAATPREELLASGSADPEQILAAWGLPPDLDLAAASGGTAQRVAIAAALAGAARTLILDEPLAWLDAAAAAALLAELARLAGDGVAVILAEHRLEHARPWATREVRVVAGRIVHDGPPLPAEPDPVRRERTPGPVARTWELPALRVGGREVLGPTRLAVRAGERVALVGPNGSGKSTLLRALAAAEGRRAVLVPQDPDLTLFCRTVEEELGYAEREAGRPSTARERASQLGLPPERSPHALSRGERVRLAIGAAAAAEPDLLLLDEPTAGQDPASVARILDAVGGRPVIFATHDPVLARGADVVWRIAGGAVHPGAEAAAEAAPAVSPGGYPARPPGPDARRDLALVFAVGCLAVLLDHPLALGLLALAPTLAVARAAPRWRVAAGIGAAAFVWSAVVSQGLFFAGAPRTPLASLGPVVVWREGVAWGLRQGLRAVATSSAGLALVARHPGDRLGAALTRIGFPGGLAILATASLRALPSLADEAGRVREARDRRGRPIGQRSPLARLALEVDLLRPLVARSLRRARTLGDALRSRGVDLADPPRPPPVPPMSRGDRCVLAVAAALVLGVAVLKAITALYLAEVAYVPAWRELYALSRAWL